MAEPKDLKTEDLKTEDPKPEKDLRHEKPDLKETDSKRTPGPVEQMSRGQAAFMKPEPANENSNLKSGAV